MPVCGSLPPLTAFPRGFFAEECPSLRCKGKPGRGFAVRIYDNISEKSSSVGVWRLDSRQCLLLSVFFSGTFSLTSNPLEASANLPGLRLWGPARAAVCSDLGHNWNAPKTYAIQAPWRTSMSTIYRYQLYSYTYVCTAAADIEHSC